jgi:four helix bundle protein
MTSQIRSAAVSVACNISEGHGRWTIGEYLDQLSDANGSIAEVYTLLDSSRRLEFGNGDAIQAAMVKSERVAQMLERLRQSLRRKKAAATPKRRP